MQQHKTTSMTVSGERADIDNGIYHIVYWLNSLHGVKTLNSCQGDENIDLKKGYLIPYVSIEININNKKTIDFIETTFLYGNCSITKELMPIFAQNSDGVYWWSGSKQDSIRLCINWISYQEMKKWRIPLTI